MKRFLLLLVFFAMTRTTLHAGNGDDSTKLIMDRVNAYLKLRDSVNKAMKYETGVIQLPAGVVQLNVPKGFKFLGKEQSRYIVEDLWGNLPDPELQGLLFPEQSDPYFDSSYAYIITYSPVGFIKDEDAKDINYDDLMKDMKKDDVDANSRRKLAGISAMYTNGWAAKPFYDNQKKVLHWAVEYRVEDAEENTLNYSVIVLGRKGKLTMNAVAGMAQLEAVKADVDKVLSMAEFTSGNRYSDFDSKVDDVAAWTVGGLIAGKILLKTAAGAGILKFLKLIIVGLVAAGGAVWKWITGRRKKRDELAYQPIPTTKPEQPEETPLQG